MKEEMSKEQTPLTAEEFVKSKGLRLVGHFDKKTLSSLMEQYAELRIQQEREKWKEVIEIEVKKACIETSNNLEGTYLINHSVYMYAKEYYEKEVKPKIESK